jgi:hypothetical protein
MIILQKLPKSKLNIAKTAQTHQPQQMQAKKHTDICLLIMKLQIHTPQKNAKAKEKVYEATKPFIPHFSDCNRLTGYVQM